MSLPEPVVEWLVSYVQDQRPMIEAWATDAARRVGCTCTPTIDIYVCAMHGIETTAVHDPGCALVVHRERVAVARWN